MSAARSRAVALALVLLALAVRLAPVLAFGTEAADLATYRDMAETVRRGDDVYARSLYFPYTPWSQFIPALALELAERTGWSFHVAMRLPAIAADAATTWLLFCALARRGASRRGAVFWTLLFALNPVAILISAFHGNLMSVVAFLVLAAAVAATEGAEAPGGARAAALSAAAALLLGLAIAMRSFPVLLLPVLLGLVCRSLRRAVFLGALALLPSALAAAPYLVYDARPFLREVVSYGGFPDFGWLGALRAGRLFLGGDETTVPPNVALAAKGIFLAGYGLALYALKSRASVRALLLAPLLFYAVYTGVSAQYLVWALPIAVLCRDRFTLPFSAAATLALVSFYRHYHPAILFGSLAPEAPAPLAALAGMAIGNALLVLVCLAWVADILRSRPAPADAG